MQGIKKRLVLHYCLIIFLTVLVLEGLFIAAVRQYYYGTAEQVLVDRAAVSATFYSKYLPYYSLKDKARYILDNVVNEESARVEIIDWRGNVVVDSNGFKPAQKVDTPDFQTALQGKTGVWYGKSNVTGERVLAVASPLREKDKVVGVLRYVSSMEGVYNSIVKITVAALAIGLLVVLLVLAFSLLLARSIITPIQEVTLAAEQMAMGNFSVRAVKRDDDETGKLAETLNYMAGEIVKTEKIKNDFLSSVSHELRTPLTSIKGWGETVLSGGLEDRAEAVQGLEIICKEADRMIGLVEELLDFSRFQSGRIKIQPAKVNINRVVEEVERQFVIKAKEKNIDLRVKAEADRAEITGDCNRLKQVLINLLDNALKFTPPNGMIQIATRQDGDAVKIEVRDSGEGIAPDDLPRVTGKFYKVNAHWPGSGLGLSICEEIVKLYNGDMEITSELGEWTKVTIILPARQQERC